MTIVEPEISLLDWKLCAFPMRYLIYNQLFFPRWTTYLIVFGILGGGAYLTLLSYAPKPKKARATAPSEVVAPVPVVATSSGGYEEEWIPEHHLKKTKKSGAGTTDAETSGGEASGKEGPRRRRGRK